MADDLMLEDIRRWARDIGLTRLTDEHLEQLLRATRIARGRRAALPTGELTPVDEPAHVYSLARGAGQ